MKETREIRVAEIRAKDTDDGPVLEGYAAKFNKLSEDLGGFREKIRKGAFSRSLKEQKDIRAFFDHDTKFILGRTISGTLELEENSVGLRMRVKPPDTQMIRDLVIEPVRRGDINQMSFGFMTRDDEWLEKDSQVIRTLNDVDLFEVSVVSMPAYNDTSVALRKMQSFKEQADPDVLSPSGRFVEGGDAFVPKPDDVAVFEQGQNMMRKIGVNY